MKKSQIYNFLRFICVILLILGVCSAALGWYASVQATHYNHAAMYWNGKLTLRRIAIVRPQESQIYADEIDVIKAEEKVNHYMSKTSYFSTLVSQLFGIAGIMLSVAAIIIAVVGVPVIGKKEEI